jgi:hypothetical protein
MLKRDNDLKGLEVDLELTPAQQAILSSFVRSPGFDLLQKLMEDQVRKFNLKLINTDLADKEQAYANLCQAKTVAQFYMGLMQRLESELQIEAYNNSTVGSPENPENTMQIDELQ